MLLAFIFVPLLGAALMPILRKIWKQGATIVIGLITSFLLVNSIALIHEQVTAHWSGRLIQVWREGHLALRIDGLSLVALVSISLVALVAAFFSFRYPWNPDRRPGCYALMLLTITGMNGLVMATDLFSLYVFLEILSVSAFILIASRLDELGVEGSFKYMMLSAVATTILLVGIALLFAMTGNVTFTALKKAGALSNSLGFQLALAAITFAFVLKAGVMPFHGWLPDAYTAAPAPVSILLAGIVTKIAGVYTLMRVIIEVFGFTKSFTSLVLFLGSVSMILGAFFALGQKDFKRMLAFSSISQIGYIMAGFAVGTPLGLLGAMFHFFNHAVFKSLLFVNAGAVEQATGTRNFDKLGGLAKRMPVTGVTSVIGLLSAAGIPPLGGFWSKLVIIIALWQAGFPVYAMLAVFASVITLAYLLTLQREVFFGKVKEGLEGIKEVTPSFYWPAILLAAIAIVTGLFYPVFFNHLILPAQKVLELIVK
ncbi:multicomponent Na+:H+ antiporter subunit D [Hydrogenispora ethanolica]|uniref:Multicomponent Na+:H+ antiporter subunit D n=1 Tax=Hydrogenispora ethanolica TaxID=1082276 RepID=A0A4R1R5T6_HYDET|nr:proton-conducting transporter membrane subunit [Hydrogenispora ethanolica]TCL60893.1 multicomponent Na+:H+ antiporter subunit D [Hydrogenispora ethanolica]